VAKYSRAEIEGMAVLAGWGRHARDASWVAMAESSGDASIVNSIGATGLMQVLQPVHVKANPGWSVKWLQNPMNNLRAAKKLFDQAGQKWDGPWLDSRDKGGLPTGNGGWGQHVKGSGGGISQVDDDPCDLLPEGPARDWCERDDGSDGGTPDMGTPLDDVKDTAEQLGRIAQAIAKGANWIADPANWVRVVYVVGGGVLTVAAVNVIARPAIAPAVQAVKQVVPTKTYQRVRARAKQKAGTP
jgi:hypothetical protein